MLRKRTYGNTNSKLYNVVLGQCSKALEAKLEGKEDWDTIQKGHDLVNLMKSIKVRMLNQQEGQKPVLSTYSAISTLFRLRQSRHENLEEYRKRFVETRDVLEHIRVVLKGGQVKIADKILQKDFNKTRDNAKDDEANIAETREGDRLLVIAFIKSADEARYGEVITDLENAFIKGINQLTYDITAA